MPRKEKVREKRDIPLENFNRGYRMVYAHPLFAPMVRHATTFREEKENLCPRDGWAVVTRNGDIHVHPTRTRQPEEWAYILAHCLLHLGFGHFQERYRGRWKEWNAACDCFIAKFLADLKFGCPPSEMRFRVEFTARTEESLFEEFCDRGIPASLQSFSVAGPGMTDMKLEPERTSYTGHPFDWQNCFGKGLSEAITSAVNVAAGVEAHLGAENRSDTPSQRARSWFISSYPLLGSLAAGFSIIEDPILCQRMDVSIAAVDPEAREIYMNPAAGMDEYECRFVMAHELLHVGLCHSQRRQGRDPYLWNIACDYVVDGWLLEMGIGEMPQIGVLYDPALKGESAEAIYDRIVTDLRRYRKLCTMRGIGIGDILDQGYGNWWETGNGCDLDEFYRRSLAQGLSYHESEGRGLLPSGLVEEIRALDQPPIPWDVELARWFDGYFSPMEQRRTYARPSRRQSSTPDIPRPQYVPDTSQKDGRTFGVVLDTSGSMDRELLGKALGAVASYSLSRDVPLVRVIFCDAAAYDAGYMPPEDLAERVRVKGRGGTILQPGVDLLERAENFPKHGPLLLITDGFCDRLRISRQHAFLIPHGGHLPFVPKGPVFRVK